MKIERPVLNRRLNLEDDLRARPEVRGARDQAGAHFLEFRVGDVGTRPCPGLDEHVVAGGFDLADRIGCHGHAAFPRPDLLRDADLHGERLLEVPRMNPVG